MFLEDWTETQVKVSVHEPSSSVDGGKSGMKVVQAHVQAMQELCKLR